MKEPSGLLRQDLTSRAMRKEVMQTAELVSTRESTEIMIELLTVTMRSQNLIR